MFAAFRGPYGSCVGYSRNGRQDSSSTKSSKKPAGESSGLSRIGSVPDSRSVRPLCFSVSSDGGGVEKSWSLRKAELGDNVRRRLLWGLGSCNDSLRFVSRAVYAAEFRPFSSDRVAVKAWRR